MGVLNAGPSAAWLAFQAEESDDGGMRVRLMMWRRMEVTHDESQCPGHNNNTQSFFKKHYRGLVGMLFGGGLSLSGCDKLSLSFVVKPRADDDDAHSD
jgi:hypothetical protein